MPLHFNVAVCISATDRGGAMLWRGAQDRCSCGACLRDVAALMVLPCPRRSATAARPTRAFGTPPSPAGTPVLAVATTTAAAAAFITASFATTSASHWPIAAAATSIACRSGMCSNPATCTCTHGRFVAAAAACPALPVLAGVRTATTASAARVTITAQWRPTTITAATGATHTLSGPFELA